MARPSRGTMDDRVRAIYYVCERYVLESEGYYLASWLELAWHLNNTWHARLFFTRKELERYGRNVSIGRKSDGWVISDCFMCLYMNRIKSAVERIDGARVLKRKNGLWFMIPMEQLPVEVGARA